MKVLKTIIIILFLFGIFTNVLALEVITSQKNYYVIDSKNIFDFSYINKIYLSDNIKTQIKTVDCINVNFCLRLDSNVHRKNVSVIIDKFELFKTLNINIDNKILVQHFINNTFDYNNIYNIKDLLNGNFIEINVEFSTIIISNYETMYNLELKGYANFSNTKLGNFASNGTIVRSYEGGNGTIFNYTSSNVTVKNLGGVLSLNFSYYKTINIINNNVTNDIDIGDSLNFSFSHSELVTNGKSLSNGNDIVIYYFNSSDSSYTQLDRINTTDFNNVLNNTTIWFSAIKNISANGFDDGYRMYYGNTSPISNPPSNLSKVVSHYGNELSLNATALIWANSGNNNLAKCRDNIVSIHCWYTLSDAGGSGGFQFPDNKIMGQIRFYSSATSERVKDFTIEKYDGGIFTKIPIIIAEGNLNIINNDEGRAGNLDGWNNMTFYPVKDEKFWMVFTSTWNIGDPNAGISEIEMYEVYSIIPHPSLNLGMETQTESFSDFNLSNYGTNSFLIYNQSFLNKSLISTNNLIIDNINTSLGMNVSIWESVSITYTNLSDNIKATIWDIDNNGEADLTNYKTNVNKVWLSSNTSIDNIYCLLLPHVPDTWEVWSNNNNITSSFSLNNNVLCSDGVWNNTLDYGDNIYLTPIWNVSNSSSLTYNISNTSTILYLDILEKCLYSGVGEQCNINNTLYYPNGSIVIIPQYNLSDIFGNFRYTKSVPFGNYYLESIYNISQNFSAKKLYFTVDDIIPPNSNNPSDIDAYIGDSLYINWILTDNYLGGCYNITRNNTIQNNSICSWVSGDIINVWGNTSQIGVWNYSISYNDSVGLNGVSDYLTLNVIATTTTTTTLISGADINFDGLNIVVLYILIIVILILFVIGIYSNSYIKTLFLGFLILIFSIPIFENTFYIILKTGENMNGMGDCISVVVAGVCDIWSYNSTTLLSYSRGIIETSINFGFYVAFLGILLITKSILLYKTDLKNKGFLIK